MNREVNGRDRISLNICICGAVLETYCSHWSSYRFVICILHRLFDCRCVFCCGFGIQLIMMMAMGNIKRLTMFELWLIEWLPAPGINLLSYQEFMIETICVINFLICKI